MVPWSDARQVRELFDQVVDLSRDQRRQYLDEHCPDQELRLRIERLLAAYDLGQESTQDVSEYVPGFTTEPLSAAETHGQETEDNWPVLPGYEILGKLGQGGMGVVYKARQVALKRIVALKMIRPGIEASAERLRRFRIEAEAVAKIQHPNIVQIYDVGEHEGQPFLVLEFIDGGSLADHIQGKPWPSLDAAKLLEHLARAIHEAHKHGIIHRDLKPSNVLLPAGTHTPKVTDFGLVKLLDGTRELTHEGAVLGTPAYMAPEQASGMNHLVDRAADIYALGATLYELLTGRPPFLGATPLDTLRQVSTSEPLAPRQLQPGVPADLETICLKCLRKEQHQRYASALDLAEDLQRFQNHEPIRARPVSRIARARMWCRRNPPLAVASGLIAVALLTIVVLSVIFGIKQGQLAEERQDALTLAQREVALSTWDRGRQLCEEGEVGHGLLLMAKALEKAPSGPQDTNLREALSSELAGWHRLCNTLAQAWPHPDKVFAVAVSPDGSVVATGCADGMVRLWELASGKRLFELAGHQGAVHAVGFSDQGDIFLTGGADGNVYVWDAALGQQFARLDEHTGPIHAVALSSNGKLALTGGADKRARLWDMDTRTLRATLDHSGAVRAVAFSRDGQTFFTGGENEAGKGEMRLYKTEAAHLEPLASLEKGRQREFPNAILSACFSSKDQTLLVGDANWAATFWDTSSLAPFALTGSQGSIRGVAFSPDGTTALTGAYDSSTAQLWDVAALRAHSDKQKRWGVVLPRQSPRPLSPPLFHPSPVTAVAFLRDGKGFVTACEDGYVRVWGKAPGNSTVVLGHHPKQPDREYGQDREFVVRTVAFDPLGRYVATGGWDGKIRLWNVPSGMRDGIELVHDSPVMTIAFTPDGKSIVSGGKDSRLLVWDVETRKRIGEMPHHAKVVSGLSISDDGELLLAGGDGSAHRWNLRTLQAMETILPHGKADVSVATAISPSKNWLLTAGEDHWAKLWDSRGVHIHSLKHDNEVRGSGFSPNGEKVVTASDDGTARVWDVASGRLLTTLQHKRNVFSAAFVRGSNHVLTGSTEGGQLWDVQSGRRIGPPCRYEDDIVHLEVSPDGRSAVLADWSGYGLLWSLPEPVQGNPDQVAMWVQSAVGMKLDDGGGRQVLDGPAWLKIKERQRQLSALP